MFLYRIARTASETFPLLALAGYILAFLVVFPCVFLFPPLGLMMFGMSLASLPFTWVIGRGLIASESALALRILDSGSCPQCAKRMQTIRDIERAWMCEFCETRYQPDGRVVSDRMVDDVPVAAAGGSG
jgi:ribosomal protein L37AE/L43A